MKETRPWFDIVRSRLGYRFPRLGPLFFRAFFAMARKRCMVELFPGIVIEANFGDLTHMSTYWQGERHEYPTAPVLLAWAADPRFTAFFDIGANYGFFSYLMLSRTAAPVYAFEPNPVNYRQLEAAKSRNGLTKLHPQRFGLSDEETRLTLRHGIIDQGHSTFLANAPGREHADVTECRVVRFDDWIFARDELPPLQDASGWIAKIDVEGFEPKVLRGMEDSLRRRRFLGLSVELNESTLSLAGATKNDVRGFLAECGYTAFENTAAGRKWLLHRAPNGFFVPQE